MLGSGLLTQTAGFQCGMIMWVSGHFVGVPKYEYHFFCDYFFFLQRWILQKFSDEGRNSDSRNNWLARFLEPVAQEGLWIYSTVCFDFQFILPLLANMVGSSLGSRVFLTQFPDKQTSASCQDWEGVITRLWGVRKGLGNSICYVDLTLIVQESADKSNEVTLVSLENENLWSS